MKSLYITALLSLLSPIGTMNAQHTQEPDTPSILNEKQKKLISLSAYAARGDLPKLKIELNEGLDAGLTINKIKESLIHLYAYCGFPRSIRSLQTFIEVLDERKANGINDEWGMASSPIKDKRSKYERGTDILVNLTKMPPETFKSGYAAFAPELEIFLKEHLFADLFERDALTYAERQLITVSVLVSIGGVEPMLRSHLNNCLNVGLSPNQLHHFAEVIRFTLGEKEAQAAQAVVNESVKQRGR